MSGPHPFRADPFRPARASLGDALACLALFAGIWLVGLASTWETLP